jgi:hypothetical protein
MPEYGKLATLGRWVTDSALNEYQKRSIQEDITDNEDLPPIFLRLESDICLVREDRGAVLSREGRLLNSIFEDPENPATKMLFGIRHIMQTKATITTTPKRQTKATITTTTKAAITTTTKRQ